MSFSVSWSAAPRSCPQDREFFTSEDHAVDCAFDWSVERHGEPIVIFCNDQEWMEVTA